MLGLSKQGIAQSSPRQQKQKQKQKLKLKYQPRFVRTLPPYKICTSF